MKWLSLGSRFTLIKAVLEGQPVYWMALAAIPVSIITKLRQLTYNFLWSGCSDHSRHHLSSWESLAKPKHYGGWGLRNTFHFSKALAANSLWRVLTTPSIGHSIIKDKYLPHLSVSSWLNTNTDIPRVTSYFWKTLLKAKFWIVRRLCWQLGSGHSIRIGCDRILGSGINSILPPQMIAHLHERNLWYLYQARDRTTASSFPERWISSDSLGLCAEHATL